MYKFVIFSFSYDIRSSFSLRSKRFEVGEKKSLRWGVEKNFRDLNRFQFLAKNVGQGSCSCPAFGPGKAYQT